MYSIVILYTKIHFTQDLLEETSYFCYIATRFVIKINIKQENECRERSSNLWRVVPAKINNFFEHKFFLCSIILFLLT